MIRIVTDTAADITLAQADALGIEIIPLDVMFEETPYYQLEDEDFSQFYGLLESSKKLPTTSQPSPERFLQVYEAAALAGDQVLVITISSALSGTYSSAILAKDLSGYEDVHVVDSKSAAMGQRLLAELAVKMRDEGKPFEEIAAAVEDAASRIVLFASLDTLKYLRKGGRIPKSTELVGSMMNIKPLITLDENGAIVMAGKARGQAGAVANLIKLMDAQNDIDVTVPVYFGYSKEEINCRKLEAIAIPRYGMEKRHCRYPVGSTVGTHVGPGAMAVVYLKK